MVRNITIEPKTPHVIVSLLWLVGLMPVFLVLLVLNGVLAWGIALVLIEMSIVATFFFSLLAVSVKRNNAALLAVGGVLVAINSVLVVDLWSEYVFASRCGTYFFAGNCFLADGIEKFWYFLLFPPMLIATNILFSLNIAQKHKN